MLKKRGREEKRKEERKNDARKETKHSNPLKPATMSAKPWKVVN
jgi:hypothetical protein